MSELEDLVKHELDGLMETLDEVNHEVAATPITHIVPPAVQIFVEHLLEVGNGSDVRAIMTYVFRCGLKEGEKGKTFADYTRHP